MLLQIPGNKNRNPRKEVPLLISEKVVCFRYLTSEDILKLSQHTWNSVATLQIPYITTSENRSTRKKYRRKKYLEKEVP